VNLITFSLILKFVRIRGDGPFSLLEALHWYSAVTAVAMPMPVDPEAAAFKCAVIAFSAIQQPSDKPSNDAT
jgi:hypothetical protein